jgi:hypothetical protein
VAGAGCLQLALLDLRKSVTMTKLAGAMREDLDRDH